MTEVEARFWSKVDKSGECWLWTASTNGNGYGIAVLPRAGGTSRKVSAHRRAYELAVGPIPEGMQLDHLCRVRHCVNPAHLEPVTQAENIRRGISLTALNARKTHCKRGHEFTPENTRPDPKGGRVCRSCHRDKERQRYAERVRLTLLLAEAEGRAS